MKYPSPTIRVILTAIAILLLASCVFTDLQPSDTRAKEQKPEVSIANTANHKDEVPKLTSTSGHTSSDSSEGVKNKKPNEDKALIVNEKIANYTFYLAVVAALQFIAMAIQAIFLCKTLGATKEAANAAQKAAEAAELTAQSSIGAELPRFVVTSMVLRQASPSPYVTITITNHGRTEAIVTGECAIFRKEPSLPPNPRYPISTQKFIDFGQTIQCGESYQIGIPVSAEDITGPVDGSNSFIVWAFGFIKYRDFLNKKHIYGFVGGASLPSTTKGVITAIDGIHFQQQGPSAYTYSKYADND